MKERRERFWSTMEIPSLEPSTSSGADISKGFRLPEELVAALERRGRETGKTLTEVVIETLEAGLVAQERPGPEAETLRGLYREANRAKEILDKALRGIKS